MSFYSQYNSKFDGTSWESMMQLLLLFEDPHNVAYSRPGRDNGIDAVSGDGLTVYQAKFHEQCSIRDCIDDLKSEMSKIKGYRESLDYWKPVKKWVLFANVEKNPNDGEKWDDAVKECDCCGLDVVLWDWPAVWKLLEKFPEVKQDFLEGESRCFLLKREFEEKCLAQYLPESFQVDCVGREKELQAFKNFLESDKKIWSFSGPGGMGKSRFLIECAKVVDCEKWNVYFGIPDFLKLPTAWNKRVVFEHPSILFIDELNDVDLLNRLLAELTIGGMRKWKAVFSERNANAKTILELNQPKYNSLCEDSVVLSRFNHENRRVLVSSLLDVVEKNRNIRFVDKEKSVHNICEVSQGIPLWISIVVDLIIKQNGELGKAFENNASQICKKYIDAVVSDLPETSVSRIQYEDILKWSSLYRQISLKQNDVVEFICEKVGIDGPALLDTYNLMSYVGLMQKYGFENKVYSICPDVIRENILKSNLIFENKLSIWGNSLVEEMIAGSIPCIENVVDSLSRIENKEDVDVLTQFVESIGILLKNSPFENHRRLWSVVGKISLNRTEKVLDIVENLIPVYSELQDVDEMSLDFCLGEVKNVLSICLYGSEDFASRRRCLDLFFVLIKNDKLTDRYGNIIEDFLSPIFEGDLRESYADVIDDILSEYFEGIRKDFLSQNDLRILKEILDGIFETEYHSCVSFVTQMMFRQGHFGLDKIVESFKWIKEIEKTLDSIDIRTDISDVLIEAYGRFIGNLLRYPQRTDEEKSAINVFLKEKLQWCADFVKSGFGLQSKKRNLLRDRVWNWILQYDKESDLYKYAVKCEASYCLEIADKEIIEYLNSDYRDDEDSLCENLVRKNLIGKDIDDILIVVERMSYYCFQQEHKIQSLATNFAKTIDDDDYFLILTSKITERFSEVLFKKFFYGCIVGFLPKRRTFSNLIDLVQSLMNKCSDKQEFLRFSLVQCSLYSEQTYNLLVQNYNDKNTVEYANVMAMFTVHMGEGFLKEIDGVWNVWSENPKEKFLLEMGRNILSSSKKWTDTSFEWSRENACWLVDKIALMPDLDAFENLKYDFEEMKSIFCSLKNIRWLRDVFILRSQNGLKFGLNFSLTYFVASDFCEEEQDAFSKIIEIVRCGNCPYGLEEEIVKIDPLNQCLGKIVVEKIETAQSDDEKLNFASIAGYLKDDSPAWMEISSVVCKLAKRFRKKEKIRLWSTLSWKGVETYSSTLGQVSQTFYNKVKHFKGMLNKESLLERKEYWQWQLESATSELEFEEQRAKELRGE